MADLTVGRGNGRISRASFSNLLGPLCFKVDLGSTRKFHERKLAQSLPREFLHGFMIASKLHFSVWEPCSVSSQPGCSKKRMQVWTRPERDTLSQNIKQTSTELLFGAFGKRVQSESCHVGLKMLEAPEPCPPNADLWRAHSNPSAEAPALLDDVEIDLMSSDSSPTLPAIPPAATGFPAQAQPSWPPPLGSSASAGLRRAADGCIGAVGPISVGEGTIWAAATEA